MKRNLLLALFLVIGISSIGVCATFEELMVIARNPQFQDRVKYAMQKSAIDIMNEANDVANHPGRLAFSINILQGRSSMEEFAIGVLTNSTIAAEANINLKASGFGIPDADIQFAANSQFEAFAGIGK